MREMLFALAYRDEAMELAELVYLSTKVKIISREDNNVKMAKELDLLDERREAASRRIEAYQCRITRDFNTNVKFRKLTKCDLVLRRVTLNTRNPSMEF